MIIEQFGASPSKSVDFSDTGPNKNAYIGGNEFALTADIS
jgi:hypothetical protein